MGDPGVAAAMLVALASTCGFAFSTSLQHRSAGDVPTSVRTSFGVLRFLVVQPPWLLGIAVGGVAFSLHALALKWGAIAVVQPIMIAGVVLAVPVRAALDRIRPSSRELGSVVVTAVGLATFLVMANPVPSAAPPDRSAAFAATLLCLGSAALLVWLPVGEGRPRARAMVLGVATGILFGLVAGLVKLVLADLERDPGSLLTSWPLWALVGAGISGTAINQRAYQIAPLSMSMPVLNVVDVLVAIGLGAWVFAEPPAHGATELVIQAAALTCMGIGIHQIALTHRAEAVL